ncbi:MAG: DUF1501 domain-containing protein [Caldilineae bacterium]|nr:MAG: DUF1501 domain-containing protein [Caldilineae bacterium]
MEATRRDFLKTAGYAAMMGLGLPAWMPRLAFSTRADGPPGDILICVFLRGGIDGMSVVVPYAEDNYHESRPTLGIPEPGQQNGALDLDGFFGLHPALAPLLDIYTQGDLAVVHATGSPDPTRSHFDAMDYMERGTPGEKQIETGWLGRHLASAAHQNDSPFRAIGMGALLPQSLRGPVPAVALQSIADFHLQGNPAELAQIQQTLAALYSGDGWLDLEGQKVFDAFALLEQTDPLQYDPQHGAEYPDTSFGLGLKQVAQLIRAEVGLEVACLDVGGWDTHANQGVLSGQFSGMLTDFGAALSAFYTDMQDQMGSITLVTMSEFGRRLRENASAGTDHGHGNQMLVMGGGIIGGHVYGNWPGLDPEQLDRGDLAVTTDYRTVLSELVLKRLLNDHLDEVFPHFEQVPFLGLAESNTPLPGLNFLPLQMATG